MNRGLYTYSGPSRSGPQPEPVWCPGCGGWEHTPDHIRIQRQADVAGWFLGVLPYLGGAILVGFVLAVLFP